MPPAGTFKDGASYYSIQGSDQLYLEGSSHIMTVGPQMSVANLHLPAAKSRVGIRKTPFNVDIMGCDETSSPSRYLNDCLAGRAGMESHFLGTERVNGVELLMVSIRCKGFPDIKYGFDPKRGYLLAYYAWTDDKTGKKSSEVFLARGEAMFQGTVVSHAVGLFQPNGIEGVVGGRGDEGRAGSSTWIVRRPRSGFTSIFPHIIKLASQIKGVG